MSRLTPQLRRSASTRSRATLRRIETLEVDAARQHRDAFPRRAVAVVDQLRELLAYRDDAVAARHDAVVEALEKVLLAKTLVPGGDEGQRR